MVDASITLKPKELTRPELHHLLLSAIAPRPIAFASTIDRHQAVNLSPFSFFNVFSSNPPIMIFSPARSGRDNTLKHTHQNLIDTPEVAINAVSYSMVEQMSLASTAYEKGVNEFIKSGLTQIASTAIRPPRVKESPVAFECQVKEIVSLGDHGGAGNLVICEVLLIHVQEKHLDARGQLDTTSLDLVGRMGGSWYCRASDHALFSVKKPSPALGIGVDALPNHVRNSTLLTGNQLGKLGGLPQMPTDQEIAQARGEFRDDDTIAVQEIHQRASALIEAGKTRLALSLLLSIDES